MELIKGKNEKKLSEDSQFKCRFCSQPMKKYIGKDGKEKGYICECKNYYEYFSLMLEDKQLKKRQEAIAARLNELAQNSDYYKKLVRAINENKEAEIAKTSKNLEEYFAHSTIKNVLLEELQEYYWMPVF